MFDGMPEIRGDSLAITTLSLSSAFESSKAEGHYQSDSFRGFLRESPYSGQPFSSETGDVSHHAADGLIPALLPLQHTGGRHCGEL
ncbi:MAG: hypothetical protein PHH64_07795 [Proteiniphilum sp.]|nr:hypothetical protein [Proteiniphilum sp.]MDD4800599.1 hypothetical protein [Proteiniphilum sp.]